MISPSFPTVSVIVASYNHAQYLSERIDSLLAQTYPEIEIIVIDDCSTDDSVEVLQPYCQRNQIRLIQNESNLGWVSVSNLGLSLAKGAYVLFANCDDSCSPLLIYSLVATLERNDSSYISFSRSLIIDINSDIIGDDYSIREPLFRRNCSQDTVIDGNLMRRFLLHSCVIPNLSCVLFRRSIFNYINAFSSRFFACSDWDLFFRASSISTFCYVAEPLNFFRSHPKSIRSITKYSSQQDDYLYVLLPRLSSSNLLLHQYLYLNLHVMYLFSIAFLASFPSSAKYLFRHLIIICKLNPFSLGFLPFALVIRLCILAPRLLLSSHAD